MRTVHIKTTEAQYSPVSLEQARLVRSYIYMDLHVEFTLFSKAKKGYTAYDRDYAQPLEYHASISRWKRERQNNNNNYNEEANVFPRVKPEENFSFLAYAEKLQQLVVLKVCKQPRSLVYFSSLSIRSSTKALHMAFVNIGLNQLTNMRQV